MKNSTKGCRHEAAYTMQFGHLREDMMELKERVGRLEATLARGVALLLANLVGVVLTLAQQLARGH